MNPFIYFVDLVAVCLPVWVALEILVSFYSTNDEPEELEFVIISTVLLIGQNLVRAL